MVEDSLNNINKLIALRLKELIDKSSCTAGLCRFEIGIEGISPMNWLNRQKCGTRIYFAGRDNDFETAGIGAARDISEANTDSIEQAFAQIETSLDAGSNIKYYGGTAFDFQDGPENKSSRFGKWRFVVPKYEICRYDGKTVFAFNADITEGPESVKKILHEDFADLIFERDESLDISFPGISKRQDLAGRDSWIDSAARIVELLKNDEVQKVVLSRKSVLQLNDRCEPPDVLAELKNKNAGTYSFLFQFDSGASFLGSSPERLYKRNGNEIFTEALAGTRPIGSGANEQELYRQQLIESEKECSEHDYVFDEVNEVLNEISIETEILCRREVVSLQNLQHLHSLFKGRLKDGISDCDIIKAIHPTAAVNGFPRKIAREIINENEQFSREWFAGPVGWIGADSSDFAVGIRSAVMESREITLFAGAGIVKSSKPAEEWLETENKMKQFIEIFES